MNTRELTDTLANKLGEDKDSFLRDLRQDILKLVRSKGAQCVGVVSRNSYGDIVDTWSIKKPTKEYAKVLYCFCREKTYKGMELDSAITDDVVALIIKKFQLYYANKSETIVNITVEAVVSDSTIISTVTDSILESAQKAGLPIDYAIKHQIKQLLALNINTALHSSAGRAITEAGQQAVLTVVSAPIVNTLVTSIASILAAQLKTIIITLLHSTAFKSTMAILVKKYAALIIIPIIMNFIAANVGITTGGLIYIVLIPLLFVFIRHQFVSFPEKLGKKLSERITNQLSEDFININTSVAKDIATSIAGVSFTELGKKIYDDDEVKEGVAALLNNLIS